MNQNKMDGTSFRPICFHKKLNRVRFKSWDWLKRWKLLLAELLHISVVPGNELEGLVAKKDGEGELQDNHPLIE